MNYENWNDVIGAYLNNSISRSAVMDNIEESMLEQLNENIREMMDRAILDAIGDRNEWTAHTEASKDVEEPEMEDSEAYRYRLGLK